MPGAPVTGRSRTSLALEDLLAAAPDDWTVAAPPGSEPRRWLALLTAGLRSEARLSAYGQYLARSDLLRGARAISELHRAAAGPPLDARRPVVVIAGLPRTATTLLHTVAATQAGAWVPTTWEYDRPALIGTDDDEARRDAEAESAQRLDGFARIAPGFGAVHPMAATAPEECDVLFAHCFESFRILIQYEVPAYRSAWLASDHEQCYALLAAALRRVEAQPADGATAPVPVLKAPGHLHRYDTLRQHLPAAVVVQVHRPVAAVLPSWVDLVHRSRSAFSKQVAPRERLLAEWLGVFSAMVDHGLAVRAASPSGWIGLHYDEVIADPAGAWRRAADTVNLAGRQRFGPGGGETDMPMPRPAPQRSYDRSLPPALTAAVDDLDERYRGLVFG